MPKGTNQKFKLYRLAQIMLEKTDDEHYITMPEIMKALATYEVTADRKAFITICVIWKNWGLKWKESPLERAIITMWSVVPLNYRS